jgi:hypothetical protein
MREYAAWDYMNAVEAQYERELQFRIAAGKELNPNPTGVRYSHGEPFEYKTHQEDYTDPVKHPLAEIEDELKYNGKWRWLADKKEDWMDRHVLKGNMGSEFDRIHNGIWYALDAALIPDSYTGVALTFLPGVVKAGQAVSRLAAEAELLGRAAPELVAIDAATLSAGNDLRDVSLATGNGGQSALAPGGVVRVGTATPGAAELAQANGELGEAIKYTFGNPVRTDNLVTFFGRTTGSEVAAEAEAAIQRGAKEINIGSGTHGVDEMAANQFGSDFEMVANDSHSGQFLQEDLDTARRLQQLYPDVKIKVYDTLNPAEYESFMRQVQRATPGSDVHAIAAWCHSVRTF